VEGFAQVILALIVAANLLAYVRLGPDGVKAWWRAKLIGA
jgi:hypothetical protein